jgi:peptide/nickel transport system substrate-binding protein
VGVLAFSVFARASANAESPVADLLTTQGEAGIYGGSLVVLERAEPKTLNPVTALDAPSRDVIRRMMGDLISINRRTLETQPSVAKLWTVSRDGREYVLQLRRGLRFSDGHPMDAEDVVFTFRAYLDESVHSPQRDLLIVGGQPINVEKIDATHIRFRLAQPYAAAERIFDSVNILPRHLLEKAWHDGKLADAWGLNTPPAEIAGMGPFQLKEYVPGQKLVLQKNKYYWKMDQRGNRLPYLDQIEFHFVPSEDAQVARFIAGEADILNRVGARNFELLRGEARTHDDQLEDLGPGLEYNFLFFNLGQVDAQRFPEIAARQAWFRDVRFRQAISAAVDRDAIVRLVYGGRATALWGHVTPANPQWLNAMLPKSARSVERARRLLQDAAFRWNADGGLMDASGKPVQFSILVSSSSPERGQMATVIQDDLKKLGIQTQVVSLEFRALLDRVLNSRQYEACILGLVSGDADPNPEMNVWLSSGGSHLWNPGQNQPMTPWEGQIDGLMREQMTTLDHAQRKRLYDRVQQIAAENVPIICLASPNILVAARKNLGNFQPAVVDHYTLWNAEQLYWRKPGAHAQGAR